MRILVPLALAAGIFGFAAGLGLTHSLLAAAWIGLAVAALVGWRSYGHPVVALDEGACSPELKVLAAISALVALLVVARLTVYIVDPAQVSFSLIPSSDFEVRHSCVSAYVVAGEAVATHPNVYDDALYTAPNDDPTAIRKALMLGTFKIDVFEYPPQFLLLPRGLLLLSPAFLDQRMLWFALEGGVILLALLVVARFIGPTAGTRALLLSPLVWAAVPTISMLQKGNVQGAIIAMSMVAMVLFERRRFALGGLLLGFATVSKLYPGLLCLYLLARRQWRAAAWTAAMGIAVSVLAIVDLGWAPFAAFLQHLPGLLGGEAFPTPEKPLVWLAVLTLATLRSPFLPNAYGVFPALWILTLLAATYVPRGRALAWTLAGWATLEGVPVD